jgi:hypothetical protein
MDPLVPQNTAVAFAVPFRLGDSTWSRRRPIAPDCSERLARMVGAHSGHNSARGSLGCWRSRRTCRVLASAETRKSKVSPRSPDEPTRHSCYPKNQHTFLGCADAPLTKKICGKIRPIDEWLLIASSAAILCSANSAAFIRDPIEVHSAGVQREEINA